MERNRDLRIATTSAGNGLSRRRQRITSLKDSTEDREMETELHETLRLRDRERLQKKDRDREFPKRRRIERYAMQQKNGGEGYRENESTDASDEEYREDEEDARIHFPDRLNQSSQSSSISNNRRSLRTLRSSPVLRASVDETIGVPIPRRARSTSIKRLHDYCNSSSGKLGEDLSHRRFSSYPATASQICAEGALPSPSGASMRRKKSVEPRARGLKSPSNPRPSSEIQDDIEIEVVEALFDLMKQSHSLSQSSKNQENFDKDSVNAADEAVDDSVEEMKKDEGIEKEKFPNDSAPQRGYGFLNTEKVLSPKESESSSCVKVDAYEVQDPKVTRANCDNFHGGIGRDDTAIVVETKKEPKLEIDLMVPPPLTSSTEKDVLADMAPLHKYMAHDVQKRSETISKDGPLGAINHLPKLDLERHYRDISSVRDGGEQQQLGQKGQKNQLQTSLSPFQISLGGWPGVLPHPGYMQSQQAVLPMDDSARFRIAMQPPKFTPSQPRPKRSATHQYIARSIQQHQQLITKSLWSGPSGVATLCGTIPLNPNSMPPTQRLIPGSPGIGEYQGGPNLGAITGGSGKDKGSEVPSALKFTRSKELMLLQQASLHTPANNFQHNPAFIFPFGHHQTTVMGPAKSSGPAQSSGNPSLRSSSAGGPSVNLSSPGEEAVTSFGSPNLPFNEVAPYMAVLQNNGCQFPISTNMAMPQLKGRMPSPPLPSFNSSLYSSALYSVSQSQKLPNRKIVDSNFPSLAAAHSTQTEKQQFPPSHSAIKSTPEIGSKGSALYADTQQKSTENRVDVFSQPFAASFGLNAPSCPPLNFSSMAQNSAILPMLSDMAWNGYQRAKQKNFQTSEGKSAIGSTKIDDGLKGILGKSGTHGRKSSRNDVSPVSMMGTSIVDGLAGSVNFLPSVASGNQQPFPPSSAAQTSGVLPNLHQHQQQSIQLQKHYMHQMQQTGTAKLNASTANVVPGSFLPGSFPIQSPFFSKVSVQTDNSSYSHRWQNLPRSAAPEALSQSANLSAINVPQAKSSSGSHSGSAASLQGHQIVANMQPVLAIGSKSDSYISKNTGGSQRTASNVVNADSTISKLPSQQMEASSNGPSQKSSPACRGNVPSILSTCSGQLSELKY